MDFVEKSLGYPCFVKPANLGSNVGSKGFQPQQPIEAIAEAANMTEDRCRRGSVPEIKLQRPGQRRPLTSVTGEIIPCSSSTTIALISRRGRAADTAPILRSSGKIRHLAVEVPRHRLLWYGPGRFRLEKQSSKVYRTG